MSCIKELAIYIWKWMVYIAYQAGAVLHSFYARIRWGISPKKTAAVTAIVLVLVSVPVIIALSATNEPIYDDSPLADGSVARMGSGLPVADASSPSAMALSAGLSPDEGSPEAGLPEGASLALETEAPTQTPEPTPTPQPTPEPTVHPSNTVLAHGLTAEIVKELQERLMDLGYMENDEPTDYFGSITRAAVKYFQRQHELDVDGKVGMETYNLLLSNNAQRYTVMQGASGTDVTELQTRLYELGYMEHVTGFFGEETLEAVKKFQSYNKLSVDGKVGSKTREMLYSANANAYFMKYGEKSDEVKQYQTRLQKLGYLTTTPDGVYGKDTVAAVKRFQELNGIISDGFLGPNTVRVLKSNSAKNNALMFGMRGDDVENIQKALKDLGYMRNVTGYFGSETENAVKAFQSRNSLSSDGMVGKATMSALSGGNARRASSGSSSSGGSSSGSSSSGSGSSSTSSKLEKMISVAEGKLGSEYVFGAKGPSKFDCSGFVYYALNQAGVNQSYMTSAGWASSTKYDKITRTKDLKRGDILVFDGHVGIYTGNGGMIDASSGRGKVVSRTNIWDSSYWTKNFICGFRIF